MVRLLLAFAAALGMSAAAHAERFSNPVLGLSIEKPDDWHVLTAAANAESLKKAEFSDPEFQEAVRKYAAVPIYAFTRFPEPHADLNASVKVNTRPAAQFLGKPGAEVLQALLPAISKAMPDFKVIKQPEATSLGGRAAGHMMVTYTLKAGGAAYPAASEMWVIPRGDHLVIVGAGYRPDETTGDRSAVLKIVNSLQLSE